MPKKKQLTQIDKMRLKLKQEKIQKDQNTFLKKEKVSDCTLEDPSKGSNKIGWLSDA